MLNRGAVTNDHADRGIFPKRADVTSFFDPGVNGWAGASRDD
jgi:hypothetical protein